MYGPENQDTVYSYVNVERGGSIHGNQNKGAIMRGRIEMKKNYSGHFNIKGDEINNSQPGESKRDSIWSETPRWKWTARLPR